MEQCYKEYPVIQKILDSDEPCELDEQECKVLIEVLQLRSKLVDMESEAIYFRGCYDGIGYLKKAGML